MLRIVTVVFYFSTEIIVNFPYLLQRFRHRRRRRRRRRQIRRTTASRRTSGAPLWFQTPRHGSRSAQPRNRLTSATRWRRTAPIHVSPSSQSLLYRRVQSYINKPIDEFSCV